MAEVLRGAKALVSRGWAQLFYARDGAGRNCPFNSRHATCWCAGGAVDLAVKRAVEKQLGVAIEEEEMSYDNGLFDAIQIFNFAQQSPFHRLGDQVTQFIADHGGPAHLNEWNDEEGRTAEEVVAMLEQVAINIEEGA